MSAVWTQQCVMEHYHEPDRPRPASVGWLCAGHWTGLRTAVDTALSLDAALTLAHTARSGVSSSGRIPPGSTVPIRDHITDARSILHQTCNAWAQVITQERDLTPPEHTFPAAVGVLTRHLRWATAQAWAANLTDEITHAYRVATAAATDNRTRKVTVGPCDNPTTDGPCPGVLTITAVMQQRDLGDGLVWGDLTCDTCHRTVPISHWHAEGRRIAGHGQHVTAETAALTLGLDRRRLRSRLKNAAHRGRINPTGSDGTAHTYDLADVAHLVRAERAQEARP